MVETIWLAKSSGQSSMNIVSTVLPRHVKSVKHTGFVSFGHFLDPYVSDVDKNNDTIYCVSGNYDVSYM